MANTPTGSVLDYDVKDIFRPIRKFFTSSYSLTALLLKKFSIRRFSVGVLAPLTVGAGIGYGAYYFARCSDKIVEDGIREKILIKDDCSEHYLSIPQRNRDITDFLMDNDGVLGTLLKDVKKELKQKAYDKIVSSENNINEMITIEKTSNLGSHYSSLLKKADEAKKAWVWDVKESPKALEEKKSESEDYTPITKLMEGFTK